MKLSLKRIFPTTFVAGALFTAINWYPLHAQSAPTSVDAPKVDMYKADPALAQQIADMRANAGRLQSALAQNTSPAVKPQPMGQMSPASPATGMSPAMSSGEIGRAHV